ncbi:MAG: hypothetical protein KDE26_28450 [Bacteroidetes bacterium]|nr:hypothetical protein [Bacteroidota bacterium]
MNRKQIIKLSQSGRFGGKPLSGQLVETHISWVILSEEYAFKIKKPMKYSFLDFSTLEKRRQVCEKELMLNRRLTDIYLNVLAITEKDGCYFLGEGGQVLDYALQMKKLEASRKMDELIRGNHIRSEDISMLAEEIARFHQYATVIKTPFDKADFQAAFNDLQTISDWVLKRLGEKYAQLIERAIHYSDKFIKKHEQLFSERITQGYIRDVHGDLHAKNIFIYQKPIIFDCIEFNDKFRQIDVINEVAFFCMDLESFGKWEMSEAFMKQYLDLFPCIGKKEEEQLFIYYKSYRANVRAKVNALRAMQAEDEQTSKRYEEEVLKYLKLMDRYMG